MRAGGIWLFGEPETEKKSDLIERSDVTETFAELYDIFDDYPNIVKELHKVYDKILAIPSAEKRGEWIQKKQSIDGEYDFIWIECSECHERPYDDFESNFCPNCGARMKEANE